MCGTGSAWSVEESNGHSMAMVTRWSRWLRTYERKRLVCRCEGAVAVVGGGGARCEGQGASGREGGTEGERDGGRGDRLKV